MSRRARNFIFAPRWSWRRWGSQPEAQTQLEQAVQLRHDYAEALVALGDLLAQEKNYTLAVPTYRDALRLRPDDPSLHASLAAALRANGDAQGAAAEDQEAVRLNPTNATYQRDLGNTLYAQGRF